MSPLHRFQWFRCSQHRAHRLLLAPLLPLLAISFMSISGRLATSPVIVGRPIPLTFILANVTNTITAHELARLFVQEEVFLTIGFCSLVVIDDDSTFQDGIFQAVCSSLNIETHVAARGNHKAVGVKHLSWPPMIEALALSFTEAAYTAAYAWNSSPIDDTVIIRSVPASTSF